MKKNANKFLAIAAIFIVALISSVFIFENSSQKTSFQESSVSKNVEKKEVNEFSYQGEEGVSALDLLKEKADAEDENGFVTSINGKRGEEGNREFWAFYVNGQPARIGASDYITGSKDLIEWKIETY